MSRCRTRKSTALRGQCDHDASSLGSTHLDDLGQLFARRHNLVNDRGIKLSLLNDVLRGLGLNLRLGAFKSQ